MRRDWLKLLAVLLPVLTGCLSHTRKLQQPVMAGPALDADVLELVKGINERYDKIQSLTATIDFAASVGGAHRGAQTDYTSFRGYLLFRKPQMPRVLIKVPVLHTDAQLNDVGTRCGLALGELIQDESEKRLLLVLRSEPSPEQRSCVAQWARKNNLKTVFVRMDFPEG